MSKQCDGDCLSCDVDTYITCEKRINPDMKYSAIERLDIKFTELIGAIEEKQVDGQLSSKDHGDYELVCYCRGFIKAELEKERRATTTSPPAPGGLVCEICHKQMEATAAKAEREKMLKPDILKDLQITPNVLYEFCEWFCDYDCEEKPCKVTVSQLHERLEGIKRQMETHPEYLAKWNEKRAEQRALLQAGRK